MPDLALGAVIAFDFQSWNVQEEIALVRAAGVRRVQIYRNYLQGIAARDIRATLDAAGLTADSLHGYFFYEKMERGPSCSVASPDETERHSAIEILRGEAGFARALGCRDIIVHPVGQRQYSAEDRGDPRAQEAALGRSARDLAAIGAKADVRFLIENMPPPIFSGDAAMLRRIADETASPHVGLAFDSGHATLTGNPAGIVRAMGPRLWGVHLHDTRGTEDDHLLPGMGVVPFEDVARALAEVGFSGTFMLEVYRPTDEVRRDLTPERLAFIDRLRRLASGAKA